MQALSQAPFAARLLEGPLTHGISLGHGHLLFSKRVLSLTRAGGLRMPNGLECAMPAPELHAPVQAGRGRLEGDFGCIRLGRLWDPVPRPRFSISTHPRIDWPELLSLAGRGPGLTPLGDDVLTGYLGARALLSEERSVTLRLASSLTHRTTALSGTLLRLAAEAQLPEAAHRVLETGDPDPLLSWGVTSGSGLLAGLGLHGMVGGSGEVLHVVDVCLPLDPPRTVHVVIQRMTKE